MRLYHLSTNPNLSTMIPRIPPYNRIKIGFENGTVKRVCFAPTIKNALSAVPSGSPGVLHYIYVAVSPKASLIYKPTSEDVPEVSMTHEIWYLGPINVKKVGILVIGDKHSPEEFRRAVLGGKRVFKSTLYRKEYKRFKVEPTKKEIKQYLRTQPEYQKERRSEIIKRVTPYAVALPIFMLVGGAIKRVL